MSYKSILVNIDIDGPVVPIVNTAIDLARRHEAKLIGHCAADAPLIMAGPEGGALIAEAGRQTRDEIKERFKEVRGEFRRLAAGAVKTEWRENLSGPTRAVIEASRSADLIIMAASKGAATGGSHRFADPTGVVLRAGRPVFVIGDKVKRTRIEKVIVAWKDTREARRAVADAVPLLFGAEEVTVVSVTAEVNQCLRDGLNDVIGFLAAHGIKASPNLIKGSDEYIELFNFIDASNADLLVSGAYGHSRLSEWVFGGVTRSLLDESRFDRFISS